MHQIKIFKGNETDLPSLEQSANDWLKENQVRVVHIFGNIAPQTPTPEERTTSLHRGSHPPSDVLLVVLYEQGG
ncbi:MAG: hypothetical protein FJ387_25555 [Verrucomicrobia bacterium]|nr:hypothetical protein [Verrucomicrobiota bacterium]